MCRFLTSALLVMVAEEQHLHHVALAVVIEEIGDFAAKEELDNHRLARLVTRTLGAESLVLLLGATSAGEVEQVGIAQQLLAHMVGKFGPACTRQVAGLAGLSLVVKILACLVEIFRLDFKYHLGTDGAKVARGHVGLAAQARTVAALGHEYIGVYIPIHFVEAR